MNKRQIKYFLKSIENTYDYKNIGGGYFNVVGTPAEMFLFLNWCRKHDIWTYRVYPFCVYKSIKFKGIFCDNKDIKEVKQYVAKQNGLCLNASSPF